MRRLAVCLLMASGAMAADDARALKHKYVALTDSWAREMTFTPAETQAMEAGKRWEPLMTTGLDDPLAKKILAAGEPSFASVSSYYPGKVLDRTVLGAYSDPHTASALNDEFAIYWNGAIAANLKKAVQPIAHNTVVLFRVGPDAEMFGASGNDYSRIGYEQGYLPIVVASYVKKGIRYRETALADEIAYVRFEITNTTAASQTAELYEDVILNDGTGASASGQKVGDAAGAALLTHSDPKARFDSARQRLTHEFRLQPGETASVCLKIPYYPDSRIQPTSAAEFDAAHERARQFWNGLLSKGARIEVPEQRVNDVWRALLLQNFILADGPKFTYGSGLRYNDSTYPQENGFGAHTFAMYGFKDYANALQPYFVPMSVNREMAGRKYQNRRAMVMHHLLENYRLTGKTDVFERFKGDFNRVAEEIIADRRGNALGLLPPDKPGVDVQASTQTVYVPGHNITNCQGLQDFGEFLVRTGIDAPRGRRYIEEARVFRRTLMNAMENAAIRVPGRPPFVDLQTLFFRETPEYGPEPYDDLAMGRLQGTYFHYWVDMEFHYNFFNPDDAVGQWLADYVAERGGFVLGCTRARRQDNSPYGWINNVYDGGYYNYRLRRGQIEDFLLGFYARLAYGMSRHVYVASEGSPFIGYNTKLGGYAGADYSFPNSAANADTLLMLRNMLVLEELKDNVETGDVFLLRGAPRTWFEDGKRIAVANLPTYFGDLSFSMESNLKQGSIRASVQAPKRDKYRRMIVSFRHPRHAPIRKVTVNGASHADADFQNGLVRLPYGKDAYSIEVHY